MHPHPARGDGRLTDSLETEKERTKIFSAHRQNTHTQELLLPYGLLAETGRRGGGGQARTPQPCPGPNNMCWALMVSYPASWLLLLLLPSPSPVRPLLSEDDDDEEEENLRRGIKGERETLAGGRAGVRACVHIRTLRIHPRMPQARPGALAASQPSSPWPGGRID